MSLKDRLKRGPVEVHVPPVDRQMSMAAIKKEATVFSDQIGELVDQCNLSRQRAEWALSQLQTAHQVIQNVTSERDSYRLQNHHLVRALGELSATINGLLSLGNNARNTILKVEHLKAQLPQQEPEPPHNGNGEEAVDLDAAFEQGAPEPTQEEIDQLRNTLAKLPPTA